MSANNKNQNLTNLASPKIGTKVIEVSDDFFGKASRMLNDKEPVFIEDKYDEHGKWMDGWESKRRRDGGNDWAIIKLGSPGIISEINVDTSFFTGNFPPFASIQGLDITGWPIQTWLRGNKIYDQNEFQVNKNLGKYISRDFCML